MTKKKTQTFVLNLVRLLAFPVAAWLLMEVLCLLFADRHLFNTILDIRNYVRTVGIATCTALALSFNLASGRFDLSLGAQRMMATIIGANIADEKKNFTHFLLVRKGSEHLPAHCEHVCFAATCPHEPGALLKMLQILSVYDLNMTKIESRPIKNSPGTYCFFVEFKGDAADRHVRAALERLREYTRGFKLIGCY